MVAPDSGWADLMGWLRIPCLLERQMFSWGFEALRPFRPRMMLASDDTETNKARLGRLLQGSKADIILPNPEEAEVAPSHLDPQHPNNSGYWQAFDT